LEAKIVVAVSPIIRGMAVKGPAAKMYRELDIEPSATAVARHYSGLLHGFVLDSTDADLETEIQELQVQTSVTDIMMRNIADRSRLAEHVLNFVRKLI
ncbi:MAG TPA: hypothetical protein VGJ22_11405, partial [Anaerolineales bacterium]|jgi:LPPG:FO 2-phospho-L-lactate transferase